MTRPLMATKLYVPQLRRDLVPRPRLLQRLATAAEARLTLVSAPAGFGKTTLLTAWLAANDSDERSVAWLSLDTTDSDPITFWTYVVTALRAVVPGLDTGALDLITADSAPTGVVTNLVNDLAAAPGQVWLVLDDYHLVDNAVVGEGLALLLERLPPHVHVVISTRADPVLPLSRWRVRGELVEIRAADLRFTSGETAAYLTDVSELPLTAADVEVLEERTEGWIAALQLAALSMQGRDDVGAFIARFAGDDRYIMDYLVEEVLAHQGVPVREFLLHSAVLHRLTGSLCDALTGRDDGSRMLAALERAGLLLVALDDRREWYRYHHLFADVLRARLLAEQPDLVPVLHRRASGWLEAHDAIEEAVDHALAGQDFDRAAHLMELAVPTIRRHRQEAMLLTWLGALPEHAVRRSPVLSVFSGHLLMASGDLEAAERRLADAERALAAGSDGSSRAWAQTEELRTLPATIAIYRASVAQARGDVSETADQARRALDLAGPDDHLARGGAAGFLGLAAWAQGDVARALETFTQAVASLRAAGNLVDAISSTVVLADLWVAAGRPLTARRLYKRALLQAEGQGAPGEQAGADLHVGLSELAYEVGDLGTARRHLDASAALAAGSSVAQGRYRWFLASGRVAGASGDPDGAIHLLDQAEELYRPGFFPEVRPIPAIKARVWIAHGNLSEAADWARHSGVSVTDEPSYLREFDQLTLVRLLLAEHRAGLGSGDALGRVLTLLNRLDEAAETAPRAGSLVEVHLLLALTFDAKGDRSDAVKALGRALAAVPEPEGYGRLFLDEGGPVLTLLHDVEQQGGVVGGHARRLLTRGAGSAPAEPELRPSPARAPGETLSERELQVLRLLRSELSGPLIARELFVSHNTLRTHTKHIFTKLGVTNRRAAVQRGLEQGLI